MHRTKVPKSIRRSTLLQSKRVCCLCYHFRNKTKAIRGQFAHIDHNPQNNDVDNIAWLCLEHHDEYDGTNGLTARITEDEVKAARSNLYAAVANGDIFKSNQLRFMAPAYHNRQTSIEPESHRASFAWIFSLLLVSAIFAYACFLLGILHGVLLVIIVIFLTCACCYRIRA